MATSTQTKNSTNRLAEADEVRSYVQDKVLESAPPTGQSISLNDLRTNTIYLTPDKERFMVVEQKDDATSVHFMGTSDPTKDKTFKFQKGKISANAKAAGALRDYLIETKALLMPTNLPYPNEPGKDANPEQLNTYFVEGLKNSPPYKNPTARETPTLTLATEMGNPERLLASISSKDDKQWLVLEDGKWKSFQGNTKNLLTVDENSIKPYVQNFYRQTGTTKTDGTLTEVLFDKSHLGPDVAQVLSETHLSNLQQSLKSSIGNLPKPSSSFIPRSPRTTAAPEPTELDRMENLVKSMPTKLTVNTEVNANRGAIAFVTVPCVTLLAVLGIKAFGSKRQKEEGVAEQGAAEPEGKSWAQRLATPAAVAVGLAGTALLAARHHNNKSNER